MPVVGRRDTDGVDIRSATQFAEVIVCGAAVVVVILVDDPPGSLATATLPSSRAHCDSGAEGGQGMVHVPDGQDIPGGSRHDPLVDEADRRGRPDSPGTNQRASESLPDLCPVPCPAAEDSLSNPGQEADRANAGPGWLALQSSRGFEHGDDPSLLLLTSFPPVTSQDGGMSGRR